MKCYTTIIVLFLISTAARSQVAGPDDAVYAKESAILLANVNDYKRNRDLLAGELKNLPSSNCSFKTSLDFDTLLGCYGAFIRINSLSQAELLLVTQMHSRISRLATATTAFKQQMAALLEFSSSNRDKAVLLDISEKSLRTARWIRLELQAGIPKGQLNSSADIAVGNKEFCLRFIERNVHVADDTESEFLLGQRGNDLFLMRDAIGKIRSLAVDILRAEDLCNRDLHSPLSQVFVTNRNLRMLFKNIDEAKMIELECSALQNKSLATQNACQEHLSSPSFVYTLHALRSQKE